MTDRTPEQMLKDAMKLRAEQKMSGRESLCEFVVTREEMDLLDMAFGRYDDAPFETFFGMKLRVL